MVGAVGREVVTVEARAVVARAEEKGKVAAKAGVSAPYPGGMEVGTAEPEAMDVATMAAELPEGSA